MMIGGMDGWKGIVLLRRIAGVVAAGALRTFRTQLVRLPTMIAAILTRFRNLALARTIRARVINLHGAHLINGHDVVTHHATSPVWTE
ncbi:hypothetical protein ISP15_15895 [Dyella jejuensis]|uniref:Secreted protein n=1 Tax=Dyella jejuensis TaxID=1432009 RepID=A0ABW8JNR5_9GAMM